MIPAATATTATAPFAATGAPEASPASPASPVRSSQLHSLTGSRAGLDEIATLMGAALDEMGDGLHGEGPLPAGRPRDVLAAARAALGPAELPEHGVDAATSLRQVAATLTRFGLNLSHPHAAAHLQPPPLTVAVAADALASAGNASLDTYDSGPATLAIESWVVSALTGLSRLGAGAGGVLTPGGSMSNLLALLLARDHAAAARGVDTRRDGVFELPRPVVLTSEVAHFSVQRACSALGLGEAAVLPVAVDHRHRMRPDRLDATLDGLGAGVTPIAVVATAGTTDFGTVDPLPGLAEIAAAHDVWLHVDAAYGFGALFSDRLAPLLTGLDRADSITLDLHKLGWQPAAASAVLLRERERFAPLERQVAYLNPPDDAACGYDGLLGRSLQTTRRADAVKIAATFLAHGRAGLGQMVETCHELAWYAQRRILREPTLELAAPVALSTVVFRYRGSRAGADDRINAGLRRRLLRGGGPLVGRTEVRLDGPTAAASVCLKLTLLNPTARPEDIDELIDAVLAAGQDEEAA